MLYLKDYLNTLYSSTPHYDAAPVFVKKIFRKAGNMGLYSQTDASVYKIINEGRTLTDTQSEGIDPKMHLHSLMNHLSSAIPEESTAPLLSAFGVTSFSQTNRTALMYALSQQFFRCVAAPNNRAENIIPSTYEKAIINPSLMFDPTDTASMSLFANEVGGHCPFCEEHKKFTFKSDGSPSNFTIVKIFPEGLDSAAKEIYKRTLGPEPENYNSFENNIAMCRECANLHYLSGSSLDNSKILKETKDRYTRIRKIQKEAYEADLSPQINEILNAIKANKIFDEEPDEDANLVYDPTVVANKIPTDIELQEKVTLMALRHYDNIKRHFALLDKVEEGTFDDIATSIKHIYNKFARTYSTQEEIFNELVDWLNEKTFNDTKYRTACEIVMAFFVQNCEVFRAWIFHLK